MAAEEITIPAHFAEELKDALTSLYYFSQTFDLQDAYRAGKTVPVSSEMTRRVNKHIEFLNSMVELANAEEEDDDGSAGSLVPA